MTRERFDGLDGMLIESESSMERLRVDRRINGDGLFEAGDIEEIETLVGTEGRTAADANMKATARDNASWGRGTLKEDTRLIEASRGNYCTEHLEQA